MITPAQCRAARGLIGWNEQDLAKEAGIGVVTVHQLETGISQPRRATLDVIQRAFEAAGVEFTNGEQPGVRLTKAAAIQLQEIDSAPKPAIAKRRGGKAAKHPRRRR